MCPVFHPFNRHSSFSASLSRCTHSGRCRYNSSNCLSLHFVSSVFIYRLLSTCLPNGRRVGAHAFDFVAILRRFVQRLADPLAGWLAAGVCVCVRCARMNFYLFILRSKSQLSFASSNCCEWTLTLATRLRSFCCQMNKIARRNRHSALAHHQTLPFHFHFIVNSKAKLPITRTDIFQTLTPYLRSA